MYRDARGNAIQIYLDRKTGRVVHVWADALNQSIGFTARDSSGAPAALEWAGPNATPGTGARRRLAYRLAAPAAPLHIGLFLLGSMRVERDFQYSGRHLGALDAAFVPAELSELVTKLERLAAAERRRALALLGARDVATLRARLEPHVSVVRSDTTWLVRVAQPSFDGKHHLWLALRGEGRRGAVEVRDRTVIIRPHRSEPLELAVEVATDGPALTPLGRDAIFNDAFRRFYAAVRADTAYPRRFRRLEREVRGFELLTSREKLMAGLPNFATYFGRDMLMTALLMEPVWSDTMAEFVIAAALAKLAPSGEVSHEEALGGQAIREHAALFNASGDLDELARIAQVRENYLMVDDDFQLPVVAARYFGNSAVPSARKARFLRRWRAALLKNLSFVSRAAAPYAQQPIATNLVSFRRWDDGGWHSGSWRDSRVGYAGGRFAFDVNVVWVPAALRAIGTIDSTLRALGLAGVPEASAARRAAEIWRGSARHFEVALASTDIETRVRAKLQSLPAVERAHWEAVVARSGFPADTLRFFALSLDAEGRPIPVMSTDPAMLLLLEDLSPEREVELLRPFTLHYPVGLLVDGLGPLVANDAYAAPAVWEMFERDLYHSPRVVWGREVNVLLAALARRGRSEALEPVRQAVERSGFKHAELWSYRIDPDGVVRPVRYGASSDVQLWSLTDIAVEFLLQRLRER